MRPRFPHRLASMLALAISMAAPAVASAGGDRGAPVATTDLADAFGPTGTPGLGTVADPALAYALLADPNLIADPDTALLFAPTGRATKTTIAKAPAGDRLEVRLDPSARWLRVVSGAGAGQVAALVEVAADHVRIGRVFDLPPRFLRTSPREPGWLDVLLAGAPARSGNAPWIRRPAAGDQVVATTDTLLLDGTTPAFVTVSEVLADARLRALNLEQVQARLEAAAPEPRAARRLALPVLFTEHDGRLVTLTPNLADVGLAGGRPVLPRPWGPRGPGDRDVFEDAAREAFAGEEIAVSFTDAHGGAPWWTRLARP